MKPLEISIVINGLIEKATISISTKENIMTFEMADGTRKSYFTDDFFQGLGELRADFPHIKFLCKGSKLNVYPSSMASQMSKGLVAYEVQMGTPADSDRIVHTFDYEEKDICATIQEQGEFRKRWMASLNK
ncbi:hypothetical protein RG836_03615 [Pseudomonas sp. SZMC_28357]|uniref:hypothetical protein n=1 Tax=Pseudomonas sp. SZMC_28357 TaxID=3074380 RepID=UPI00287150B7|nr:hypothetical protein [Pseudomonas sp. SZMC_28357]MDR9750521.1 hypothetical protein [Pseudomonas sp. SZMC_28357]